MEANLQDSTGRSIITDVETREESDLEECAAGEWASGRDVQERRRGLTSEDE
jgi:hypothetical protein